MEVFDKEALYYDLFHRDKNYKREAKLIRRKHPKAKTILEIGAGTGNLTVELERLGFVVDAVEPSLMMLAYFKGDRTRTHNTTIQDFIPPRKKYDIILALYDVLNYIPHRDYWQVVYMLNQLSVYKIVEIWNRYDEVKPLTIKKAKGATRVRLGFKWGNTAQLWFIYWGKGLVINYHKLYFHL